MSPTTKAEIEAALAENTAAPVGPARSARSEQLVELAAQTGDKPLLVRALQEQIGVYEYSGESDKILVPFARLMRMWEENPADFDHFATYRLHWHFKWVTGGMIDHPSVPLRSMRGWLEEMASRYRQAGYQMHAVHAQRHHVAAHVGDMAAAQRAFEDWTAADRDQMSDCHACDLGAQGDWHAQVGDDAAALRTWQPVLDGALRCQEEPHRILAKSLLPLARLGRLADARANHLRGYRMVRGNPNLRRGVGQHIEFAALTGNEARGLEILADHAAWLTSDGEDAAQRMSFLTAVAVLLRRLVALGHADLSVVTPRGTAPTATVGELLPEVEREVGEIAARFDARNSTTAVSDRVRRRLEQRPLPSVVVLGTRGAPPAAAAPVPPVTAADPSSLEDLVAEATALSDRRHPHTSAAWERVAALGVPLPPDVEARVAESRAVTAAQAGDPGIRAAFLDVAERFAAAGDAAQAQVNRARAALAAALAGDTATSQREVAEAAAETAKLYADGQANARQLLRTRQCVARELLQRWLTETGGQPDSPLHAALRAEVADLAGQAEALGEPYAAAETMLLSAQLALAAGGHDEAQAHLERSRDTYLAAGTPWEAAVPLAILAELALNHGQAAVAEEHARSAVRHGGTLLEPEQAGRLSRVLAEACWRQGGRDEEVVDEALFAAQRLAEAAALIETALPDMEQYADEYELVHARHRYGTCLAELGEHRQAAQVLLGAATVAQGWPEQDAHASLAHDAGTALADAGLDDEAQRTLQRAADLWQGLGQVGRHVRALRARAWVLARADEPDKEGALALMEASSTALEAASPDAEINYERHETLLQTAQLLLDWVEEGDAPEHTATRALTAAEAAADGFTALGDHERAAKAQFIAVEIEEAHLERRAAAVERLRGLGQASRDRGDTETADRCDQWRRWLLEHAPE
jgi:tetratricopeptide (TPR) repeat protein